MLDGLTTTEVDGLKQSQYKHVFKKKPKVVKYLRTIGEAGDVKITNDTTPKLQDHGIHCILVGYAENHLEGCHQMYDPATQRVHQSRNVVWLHRMFYKKCNNNSELITINVSVGNWQNHGDGDLRFVEAGEGVIEDQSISVNQEEENNPVPINNEEADESNQGGNTNDTSVQHEENNVIQFPPEMDENWLRNELLNW